MQVKKGSILEDLKVPFSKPVLNIKPFLLEAPVNKAHKELDMAYNTAYKLSHKIIEAIYQFVDDEVEELRVRYLCLAHLREKKARGEALFTQTGSETKMV